MQPTTYPHVNRLLDLLLSQMQQILHEKVVGLYIFGSLVSGDYDDGVSDIDMLAAIASDLDQSEFIALEKMHKTIVANDPQWDDRLEIAYLSLNALKTFKTQRSNIGIISPGEPFHIKDAGSDWLANWYFVRENGITIYGPPPSTIIDPITKAEFVQAVKNYVLAWKDYIYSAEHRGFQAYAILTMCRGYYTCTHGEQVSKREAALWAQKVLPEWASLIENALEWRRVSRSNIPVDHQATLPETRRFVLFMIDLVAQ